MSSFPSSPGARYYQPSGITSPVGPVLMFVFGGAVAATLGLVYGFISWHNPLIYINALGCLAMAAFAGMAAGWGVKLGHVRAPALAALIGLVIGLIAIFAAWIGWMRALTGDVVGQGAWMTDPMTLWNEAMALTEQGVWSVFNVTPRGSGLLTLWGIEATAIIVVATAVSWYESMQPFCERCQRWADDYGEPAKLRDRGNADMLKSLLEQGDLQCLVALGPIDSSDDCWIEARVRACPQCERIGYLDLNAVRREFDEHGNEREVKRVLVEWLIVAGDEFVIAKSLIDGEAWRTHAQQFAA
ncbi:MAG: hypothetical protein ACF8PN_13390 [Phycisphaerales bacterium]